MSGYPDVGVKRPHRRRRYLRPTPDATTPNLRFRRARPRRTEPPPHPARGCCPRVRRDRTCQTESSHASRYSTPRNRHNWPTWSYGNSALPGRYDARRVVLRENGARVYYSTEKELAKALVNQWMNSTGHRTNILRDYWQNEGIRVYVIQIDDKTRVYTT